MKTKLLNSMRVLLAAAGMCVGANVWADEITQTIDFQALYNAGETTLKVDQYNVGVTSGTVNYCMPTYRSANFQGRMAFATIYKGGGSYSYDEWYMRKKGSTVYGLYINSQSGGSVDFAVLDLKNGDKITFTYSDGTDKIKFAAATPNIAGVAKGDAVTHNTEYTVNDDGPLYLNIAKSAGNVGISKIVIKTDVETAYAPQIYLKSANGLERTIEIKPGAGIAGSAATSTYYTTDGTTPSNTNGTLYSGTFTVNATSTNIQAITYLASGQSKLSRVLTVTANEELALSASVSLTNVSSDGDYVHAVVTPSTDISTLVGDDEADISYSFTPDGGVAETATLTDGIYTFTKTGTFKVTASCSGYTIGEASIHMSGMYYPRIESVDFSELADASTLSGTWNADGSTDAWSGGWPTGTYSRYYRSTNGYVDANLYVRTVVALVVGYGFSRNNSNEGYYRLQKLKEGEIGYVLAKSGRGASNSYRIFLGTSSTESGYHEFSLNNTECLYKYFYYSPAPDNVSGTITDCGWSTFASSYPLDLSTISGGTVYYASAASGSTVTLSTTDATTVPAGEGIMVKGTAGETFTINVAASGTAITGNLLKGQTTTGNVAASTEGTYHYVFGFDKTDASIYGFYNLAADTEVAAGKAYLETTTALSPSASRLTIVFDDETAGINSIRNSQLTTDGAVYNLRGQRVAQPTKGLYIVNGKKVAIK